MTTLPQTEPVAPTETPAAKKAPKKAPAGKHAALLLDHPGAPSTPHTLSGIPGVYHADRPTPVGGIGEATLAQAKAYDADDGCPLKLTWITTSQLAKLRKDAEQDRRAERGLTTEE